MASAGALLIGGAGGTPLRSSGAEGCLSSLQGCMMAARCQRAPAGGLWATATGAEAGGQIRLRLDPPAACEQDHRDLQRWGPEVVTPMPWCGERPLRVEDSFPGRSGVCQVCFPKGG